VNCLPIEYVKDFFKLNKICREIVLLIAVSASLAGIAYYYQAYCMTDLSSIQFDALRAARMIAVYILLPFGWALYIKKEKLADLGITRKNISKSIILGTGVYSIALVVFILSVGKPAFDDSFVSGYMQKNIIDLVILGILVSIMAMVTDLWTRGFVLMLLSKHKSPFFGIFAQNVTWFVVHIYEINALREAITLPGAIALTLTLGILGDVAALKTKNIVGLGFGHIVLNIGFITYIRLFL